MLNKNKSKNKVNTVNNSPSVNIISEGSKITGHIHTQKDIRISGYINGDTLSNAKVIITNIGKAKGNITAQDADIAGKIEGDIKTEKKLILRKSALINGNIFTKTLIVEEGAVINGSCKMGDKHTSHTQLNENNNKKEPQLKASGS